MNQEKVISLCLRRWELILITSAAVNWWYGGVLTWYHRPAGTVWWARPCRPPYVRLAAPRWWACCLGLSLQAGRRSPSSAPRRGWGALGCIRATGSAGAENREEKKTIKVKRLCERKWGFDLPLVTNWDVINVPVLVRWVNRWGRITLVILTSFEPPPPPPPPPLSCFFSFLLFLSTGLATGVTTCPQTQTGVCVHL